MKNGIVVSIYAVVFLSLAAVVHLLGIGSTHYKPVIITSNSMEPTIQTGGIVIVKYASVDEVEVGDIVMFYTPLLRGYNTHRVIEKGPDYLLTQGDNTTAPDSDAVIDDALVGKVVVVWNGASSFTWHFLNPDGSYNRGKAVSLLLALAFVLIFLYYLLKRKMRGNDEL